MEAYIPRQLASVTNISSVSRSVLFNIDTTVITNYFTPRETLAWLGADAVA